MDDKKIVTYYDYTVPFYRLFWHKGTNAIHYGFWDVGTKTHTEALINTNKTLSELVNPTGSSNILDAGCGIGGSSIWLAKEFGAHVTGITVSPKQKEKAEQHASESGVENLTTFYVRDYLHTEFSDNSFDIVWGLESVCYAENKEDFIREAYRILKPGGKIVVADGFLERAPRKGKEEEIYNTFLRGFILSNLATADGFRQGLINAGFRNVRILDKTSEIQKDAQYMYELVRRWLPVHILLRTLRLIPAFIVDNAQTGLVQRDFFKGIGRYCVFYGEK